MMGTRLSWAFVGVTCLLTAGCSQAPLAMMSGSPPTATVLIGSRTYSTVVNGYQWSGGGHSTVADAAFDPARNLTAHEASPGQMVTIQVSPRPKALELTEWRNGLQTARRTLSGASFTLPTVKGDYTYEVTSRWGNNYAAYDFEVSIH